MRWSVLVKASHTSSRGALKVRSMTSTRSCGSVRMLFALAGILLLLGLEFLEIDLEAVEALVPELAVALQPFIDAHERLRLQLCGAVLRLASAGDEACMLQDLQVFGDGRQAHVEGLRQLVHRGLAQRQAGQNGPAGRVGEGREGFRKAVRGGHSY